MPPKPFDITARDLLEEFTTDLVPALGPWPVDTVSLIDSEVSTLAVGSDKILKIEANGKQ